MIMENKTRFVTLHGKTPPIQCLNTISHCYCQYTISIICSPYLHCLVITNSTDFPLQKDGTNAVCCSVGSKASVHWLNFCHTPLGLAAGLYSGVFSTDSTCLLCLYFAAPKSFLQFTVCLPLLLFLLHRHRHTHHLYGLSTCFCFFLNYFNCNENELMTLELASSSNKLDMSSGHDEINSKLKPMLDFRHKERKCQWWIQHWRADAN